MGLYEILFIHDLIQFFQQTCEVDIIIIIPFYTKKDSEVQRDKMTSPRLLT